MVSFINIFFENLEKLLINFYGAFVVENVEKRLFFPMIDLPFI